jgi:MYXO-CTERM domain-containing protein
MRTSNASGGDAGVPWVAQATPIRHPTMATTIERMAVQACTFSRWWSIQERHRPNPPGGEVSAEDGSAAVIAGSSHGCGSGFKPAFLINYTTPIVFDPDNDFAANTTTTVDATTPVSDAGAGGGGATGTVQVYDATIPIPRDTNNAYVMLINKGNREAYYLDLSFTPDAPVPDAGLDATPDAVPDTLADTGSAGSPGTAGAGGSSLAPDVSGNNDQPAEPGGGGCDCRVGSSSNGSGIAPLIAAAACLLARRRRTAKICA